MDNPDVDVNPSQTKADQDDPGNKLGVSTPHCPQVLVSSPSEQVILASGDQPDTPVASPSASLHDTSADQKRSSSVISSDSITAAGDNAVSDTALSTAQPDKSDEPPVTVSISENPIVSDTTQPQVSDTPTNVTSDTPQQPVSDTPTNVTSDTPQQPVSNAPINVTSDMPQQPVSNAPTNVTSDMQQQPVSNVPTNVTSDTPQQPVSNITTVTSDMPQQPVSNAPTNVTSDTPQQPVSNTTDVTSDIPQRPASSSTDSGDTKVKEGKSRSSVTSHQFFPDIDIDASQSQEHRDSASVADSFTRDDMSSNKDGKPTLETGRSDVTLGGPSTSGWTTDSDSDTKDEDLFPTEVTEEMMMLARRRQMTQDSLSLSQASLTTPTNTMQLLLGRTAEKHYDDAEEHIKVKHYEKAVNRLNKAINLQPRTVLYYVERAEIFLHLCDFSSAILNYKRACVLEPDNYTFYCRLAFLYFFYGQCLFDQNLFPEALESFSRAAEMRPEVTGYHMRSIACLAALHRHGECLALVNKRLETDRENADLYILRARLHKLFRNITLCYYDVKDALSITPDHREAQKLMGLLQARAQTLKTQAMQLNLMGRTREALQKISIAIETDPSFADFHILRGALQRQLGDFNAAIDDFLLAMDKTDHNEGSSVYKKAQRQLLLTYNDFAVECFLKGFYEEAIILLNKAIKGEKTEKGLYINRGDCFFKEGNLQFSLADYQQALEIDPTDTATKARIAVIHNEYGVQDYQAKTYLEAERRFTNAIENNPQLAQYYISRAKTRQLLEDLSGARQDVLMSLHLGQSNPELIFLMTRLFPGKAVQEVLQSRAAQDARQQLQHTLYTSMPVRLTPLAPSSSEDDTESNASSSVSVLPSVRTALEPVMRPTHVMSAEVKNRMAFRSCMEEREFHIRIAKQKKTINNKVQTALHNRPPLQYPGGRVKHIPLRQQ